LHREGVRGLGGKKPRGVGGRKERKKVLLSRGGGPKRNTAPKNALGVNVDADPDRTAPRKGGRDNSYNQRVGGKARTKGGTQDESPAGGGNGKRSKVL